MKKRVNKRMRESVGCHMNLNLRLELESIEDWSRDKMGVFVAK